MLTVDLTICDGPGPVNEDVVGHHRDAAWVIDGATGVGAALLESPSDAAWLAQTASDFIVEGLTEDPAQPTRDLLHTVITRCATALASAQRRTADGPHELPSAAFAMVRILNDRAEITTLADCHVAAVDDSGTARLYGESPLGAIEARTLATVRAIRAANPDIAPDALRALLLPVLRKNRRMLNRDGGYWALGTEPAAADHLWQTTLPLRPGQRFAIASDGFLRPVELFDTATPADLLAIASSADATRWLDQLRDRERQVDRDDPHTRVKMHDDASLLVCTWNGARECYQYNTEI
ncbi:hypothetical protein GCM10011404_00790 [Sphingomonas prati]|nr:protein phosphatase 2C domain-containing protein [Sphingomonas prati]GGE72149.1 hypothetical protein GCM10011404_00790 [Sphingomonas prati]